MHTCPVLSVISCIAFSIKVAYGYTIQNRPSLQVNIFERPYQQKGKIRSSFKMVFFKNLFFLCVILLCNSMGYGRETIL